MDYRVLAADELRILRYNYTAQKTIKLKIFELETLLKSVGSGCGGSPPSGSGGNKTEHKWLSLISSIDDEKRRLDTVDREIERIELALSALSEEEAKILKMAYIENRSMDNISEQEHISRATAYRMRDTALENFSRALYGAVVK